MNDDAAARKDWALRNLGSHVEGTITELYGIERLARIVGLSTQDVEPEAVLAIADALDRVLGALRDRYATWADDEEERGMPASASGTAD